MPSVAYIIRRRRARKARQGSQRQRSAFWIFLTLVLPTSLVVTPVIVAVALAIWLYAQAASYFPADPQTISAIRDEPVTEFYERSGMIPIFRLEDPLGEQRRWIELNELPDYVLDATLLAEDRDFLQRASFDPVSILLQIWRYMLGVPLAEEQGIAAALVNETLLPRARYSGLDDDLLRVVLRAESLRQNAPVELLEWHLNTNYYGNDAFGIEAAAQVYLGEKASTLELSDAALLAAVAGATNQNPLADEVSARRRQADLLYEMFRSAAIDQDEYDRASTDVSEIRFDVMQEPSIAPDFIAYARRQAEHILDSAGYDGSRLLASAGLRITTSLDLDLYFQSECVLRSHWEGMRGRTGDFAALDGTECTAARELRQADIDDVSALPDIGTLVLIDVNSGAILSLVGAAELHAHQPAAILQPFVYMEGFLRRLYTPASMVFDLPSVYPGPADGLIYAPTNPDGRFRGPINLRDAMAAALLPPAVQVANDSTMSSIIHTAHRLGFNRLNEGQHDLEMLERGGAVSVLDAGYAYSVLASSGLMRGLARDPIAPGFRGRDPIAILRIADADGRTIWEHDAEDPANQTLVIQPSLAYLVNDILADYQAREAVLERNELLTRSIGMAALIDGMSEDRRDGWTVGYTAEFALVVRSGREDGTAMSLDPYERAASGPIWQALMNYLYRRDRLFPSEWPRPADIEEFLVCEISGMLPAATDHCPTRSEIVPSGSPLLRDSRWQSFEINRVTGQLATALTPEELRTEAVYFVPPDEILDWWIANNRPLPPSTHDSQVRTEDVRSALLTEPSDYAYVGGIVEISGSISEVGVVHYLLESGVGVNPPDWTELASRTNIIAPLEISVNWDTADLHGVYTLRLTVDFADGRIVTDTKQVTLDNTPPAVTLRTSDGLATIAYPEQEVISLLADASDNLTIERVEFYQDGNLLGFDREWPYGFEFDIDRVGALSFIARVYDQVGNAARSELQVAVVDDE